MALWVVMYDTIRVTSGPWRTLISLVTSFTLPIFPPTKGRLLACLHAYELQVHLFLPSVMCLFIHSLYIFHFSNVFYFSEQGSKMDIRKVSYYHLIFALIQLSQICCTLINICLVFVYLLQIMLYLCCLKQIFIFTDYHILKITALSICIWHGICLGGLTSMLTSIKNTSIQSTDCSGATQQNRIDVETSSKKPSKVLLPLIKPVLWLFKGTFLAVWSLVIYPLM